MFTSGGNYRPTRWLREQPLNKQGGGNFLKQVSQSWMKQKKIKNGPNPAIKKSPAQLSESYNCRAYKKKYWLHIPLTKISRLQCVAKNYSCPRKNPPTAYLTFVPQAYLACARVYRGSWTTLYLHVQESREFMDTCAGVDLRICHPPPQNQP